MDELLFFYEDAIAAGLIDGTGHCHAAQMARLRVIRLKLDLASMMIDRERTRAACRALRFVARRSA